MTRSKNRTAVKSAAGAQRKDISGTRAIAAKITNTLVATTTSSFVLTVVPVNDAPSIAALGLATFLSAINEDVGAPTGAVGTLVSSLVDLNPPAGGLDNVTDPDAGAVTGIALTGVNTANGTWFYSIDSGGHWASVGSVSDASALLLRTPPRSQRGGEIIEPMISTQWFVKIKPLAEHVHRTNSDIPEEVIGGLAEIGGFGLSVPEEYGGFAAGGESDYLGMVIATEELSWGSLGVGGSLITRPEIHSRHGQMQSGSTASAGHRIFRFACVRERSFKSSDETAGRGDPICIEAFVYIFLLIASKGRFTNRDRPSVLPLQTSLLVFNRNIR